MSDRKKLPEQKQLKDESRRKFFAKSALLGAGVVAAPMSATMFASMAKAQAAEAGSNSIKAVEEYFKSRKEGIITIVSSIAGYRGLPNSTGYGPSKSALNNLAESLYFDFKRSNVRICLVSPGFIKTPMTDKNNFKMPFLKSTEYAANKIYDGLINTNNFEIHFPNQLTLILKLLGFLPSKLYFGLIGKLTKYQKKN